MSNDTTTNAVAVTETVTVTDLADMTPGQVKDAFERRLARLQGKLDQALDAKRDVLDEIRKLRAEMANVTRTIKALTPSAPRGPKGTPAAKKGVKS